MPFCYLWILATFLVFLAHVWGVQSLLSRPTLREATQSQAVPGLLPCSTPPRSCALQTWHSRGCNYHLCTWHFTEAHLSHCSTQRRKQINMSSPVERLTQPQVSLCTQTWSIHSIRWKRNCVFSFKTLSKVLSLLKGHILEKGTGVEGSLHLGTVKSLWPWSPGKWSNSCVGKEGNFQTQAVKMLLASSFWHSLLPNYRYQRVSHSFSSRIFLVAGWFW